jgi:fibronectin-binding autotransporter adhesin
MSRWFRLVLAVGLAISAGVVVAGRPTPVSAGGCNTWTGAGSSPNWSVAANWSLGTPVNGQALCFPAHPNPPTTVVDDIAGLSVNNITNLANYTVTGESLTVAGALTGNNFEISLQNPIVLSGVVTVTGFTFDGPIHGTGSLDVLGPWPVSVNSSLNTFSGGVTVDGPTSGLAVDTGSLGTGIVAVHSGGLLEVSNTTVDNPLMLAGAGAAPRSYALFCLQGSHLNGPITLTADTTVFDYDPSVGPDIVPGHTCRVNGGISGDFQLTLEEKSDGINPGPGWNLTGPNTYTGGTRLSGSLAGSYVIGGGPTPLGTGPVTITAGQPSDLFSTGTVGDVTLDAPAGVLSASDGETPGTLTTRTLTLNSGTLTSEIVVPTKGSPANSVVVSTGLVTLDGVALVLDLRYQPPVGTAFTLVHNTSGSPIAGTFAGLPEGATFAAGGLEFSITYQGNGGQDVVVTAFATVPPSTRYRRR